MNIEERDRMIALCAQIAKEQDPDKFTKLMDELDKHLGERKQEGEPKTD